MNRIDLFEANQKTPFSHTLLLALSFVLLAFFVSLCSFAKEHTEPATGFSNLTEQVHNQPSGSNL